MGKLRYKSYDWGHFTDPVFATAAFDPGILALGFTINGQDWRYYNFRIEFLWFSFEFYCTIY